MEKYKIISWEQIDLYPNHLIEFKIEVLSEAENHYSPKYIYLSFDRDDLSEDIENIDFGVFHYPISDMYDSSDFTVDIGDNIKELLQKAIILIGKQVGI